MCLPISVQDILHHIRMVNILVRGAVQDSSRTEMENRLFIISRAILLWHHVYHQYRDLHSAVFARILIV